MFNGAVLSKVLWNDFPCRVCWHLRNDVICRGFACLLKFWVLEISWIRLLFASCIFVAKQKLCVCTFFELFYGNILAWSGKFRTAYFLPYLSPQYFKMYSQVWKGYNSERGLDKKTKERMHVFKETRSSWNVHRYDHVGVYLLHKQWRSFLEYLNRSLRNLAWAQK